MSLSGPDTRIYTSTTAPESAQKNAPQETIFDTERLRYAWSAPGSPVIPMVMAVTIMGMAGPPGRCPLSAGV